MQRTDGASTTKKAKSEKTRWRFESVRSEVHSRVGQRNFVAVDRALPHGVDRSFCSDATKVVEALWVSRCEVGEAFRLQLTADEREDLEFVRDAQGLRSLRDPRETLRKAAKLWAAYSRRCSYGVCRRNVLERRNQGAERVWRSFVAEVDMDAKKEAWSKVDFCVDECPFVAQEFAIGPLLRFLQSPNFFEKKDSSNLWKVLESVASRAQNRRGLARHFGELCRRVSFVLRRVGHGDAWRTNGLCK